MGKNKNKVSVSGAEILAWVVNSIKPSFVSAIQKGQINRSRGLKWTIKEYAVKNKPADWDEDQIRGVMNAIFSLNNATGDQFKARFEPFFLGKALPVEEPGPTVVQQHPRPAPTPVDKPAQTAVSTTSPVVQVVATAASVSSTPAPAASNGFTGDTFGEPVAKSLTSQYAPTNISNEAAKISTSTAKPKEIKTRAWNFTTGRSNTVTIPTMSMKHFNIWDIESQSSRDHPTPVPNILDQKIFLPKFGKHKESIKFVATTPLLSEDVLEVANSDLTPHVPQFSLLGTAEVEGKGKRIFTNCNAPFSAFICGLQGSGKSHTLSCLLENIMVPEPKLGTLQRPLPGLIFHFSQYSQSSFRPCEAAFLGRSQSNSDFKFSTVRSVRVLVSSSNYHNMKKAYSSIPNASVTALRFDPRKLTTSAMLQLMAVGSEERAPLYMHVLTQILRDIATESEGAFDYYAFKQRLSETDFANQQASFLKMRLGLLESFLGEGTDDNDLFCVEPGVLTVVDLSCPFVDPDTACAMFNIVLDFYVAATGSGCNLKEDGGGMIIALDEAHKYMTTSPSAARFTESLLALVRQQRHYGARIIVSTQEPSVSPKLIDLCSVTICHRFTSPEWFEVLRQHVHVSGKDRQDMHTRIVELGVGEAVVFAGNAAVRVGIDCGSERISSSSTPDIDTPVEADTESAGCPLPESSWQLRSNSSHDGFVDVGKESGIKKIIMGIEDGYMMLQVRARLTHDGGKSVMAVK